MIVETFPLLVRKSLHLGPARPVVIAVRDRGDPGRGPGAAQTSITTGMIMGRRR
jgi:hypothetical protein